MASTNSYSSQEELDAARRRLEERRRRLDRIAARYEQLEEALENLEALVSEYTLREAPEQEPSDARPRKPR